MTRRRLEKKNIRKLTRTGSGRSVSVTLPIDMIRKLEWQDRQKVVITMVGKKLVIEDWKPKR